MGKERHRAFWKNNNLCFVNVEVPLLFCYDEGEDDIFVLGANYKNELICRFKAISLEVFDVNDRSTTAIKIRQIMWLRHDSAEESRGYVVLTP